MKPKQSNAAETLVNAPLTIQKPFSILPLTPNGIQFSRTILPVASICFGLHMAIGISDADTPAPRLNARRTLSPKPTHTIIMDFSGQDFRNSNNVSPQQFKVVKASTAIGTGEIEAVDLATIKSFPKNTLVVFKIVNINRYFYDVEIKGNILSYNVTTPEVITALTTPARVASISGQPAGSRTEAALAAFRTAMGDLERIVARLTAVVELPQTIIDQVKANQVLSDATVTSIQENVYAAVTDPAGAGLMRLTNSPVQGRFTGPEIILQRRPLVNELQIKNQVFQSALAIIDPDALTPTEKATLQFLNAQSKHFIELARESDPSKPSLALAFAEAARLFEDVMTENAFQATGYINTGSSSDAIKFTWKVKPRSEAKQDARFVSTNMNSYSDDLTIPVNGNFRVNFSTGALFSGLNDEKVAIVDVPDGNGNIVKTVIDRGGDKSRVLVGALAHFYKKRNPLEVPLVSDLLGGFQPALTFGGGFTGGKPQYLLGGSALFGEDRRGVLTFGYTRGSVTRLAPGVSKNAPLPSGYTEATSSVTRGSWLLGFTFNFGGNGGTEVIPQVTPAPATTPAPIPTPAPTPPNVTPEEPGATANNPQPRM